MRVIPTRIHGILDYIVAVGLMFAPMIFGFSAMGGAAVVIPVTLGIILAVYSFFTDYELGFFKMIDMQYHLMIDIAAAAFLALSPFLFGFAEQALNVWLPHVLVGIAVILVVIFSKTEHAPYRHESRRHHHHHPRAAL